MTHLNKGVVAGGEQSTGGVSQPDSDVEALIADSRHANVDTIQEPLQPCTDQLQHSSHLSQQPIQTEFDLLH